MGIHERFDTELHLSAPYDPDATISKLRDHFPHLEVKSRCRFRLAPSLIPVIQAHAKETTIRYSRDAVEYPTTCDLPAYADPSGNDEDLFHIGSFKIVKVKYKVFGALDDEDANRDGFKNIHELKSALCQFYGEIADSEVVTIFSIRLEDGSSKTY
ncbi:hypothetical protein [Methylobacterium sp. ap11]|uniref:ASCH domain-containing protein n=1 Tax=Methylobacterium sp. ap11 TaxID=1761799 RepID=UPI001160AFB6|nr:hypothetical protein [Methylobacterium sp. ap11]